MPWGALNCTSTWVFSPWPATSLTVPMPKESWVTRSPTASCGRAEAGVGFRPEPKLLVRFTSERPPPRPPLKDGPREDEEPPP